MLYIVNVAVAATQEAVTHIHKGVRIKRLQKLSFYLLIVGGLVVTSGVVFMGRESLAKQLDNWQLIPHKQRFTELYFADYYPLPASVTSGATQKVAFTVRNLESQSTTYRFQLIARSAETGIEQPIDEGMFTLTHDHSRTIDRALVLPPIGKRVALKITLDYQSKGLGSKTLHKQTQSIHHWVNITPQQSEKKTKS